MTDYLLKFDSKEVAEQFSIANGFAKVDKAGKVNTTLADLTYSLLEIGENNKDGKFWVLFRDLVDRVIPSGAEQFIYWDSNFTVKDESGNDIQVPYPSDPLVSPTTFWMQDNIIL